MRCVITYASIPYIISNKLKLTDLICNLKIDKNIEIFNYFPRKKKCASFL